MTLLARDSPSLTSMLSERPRRVILWLALAVVTGWIHLAQFSDTLHWDSHIFMVIAQQIRLGLVPYRDLWELKPPGIFYYLAGLFTVLPESLATVRVTDWVLYTAAGACFFRICRAEVAAPLAFFGTAVWLYFAHHPLFDLGGVYTENYTAPCAVMAVAAAVVYVRTGRSTMALLSGLAIACAVLFKHPGIAALAPVLIVMAQRPRFSAAFLLWLGVLAPIALTVAYFWTLGALDDFLTCNLWALPTHAGATRMTAGLVRERAWQVVDQTVRQFMPYPILLGALAVGAPICLLRPTFLRWAAVSWVVLDLMGVAAQRNYYQHHYILTFPSTCLLGTLALGWLLQPRPHEHRLVTLPRIAIAIGLLVWALPSARAAYAARQTVVRQQWNVLLSGPGAWQKSPARRFEEEVGGFIRERTQPQDRIHVQGWGETALGVYWAAQRRVSTRFFYEAPFPIDTRRELAELQANRPEYVVVIGRPPHLLMSDWLADAYSLEAERWLDYRARIYGRTVERPFTDGVAVGLGRDATGTGLALPDVAAAPTPLEAMPQPRQGSWTSPMLRIASAEGTVNLDWSPRTDLAFNPTGHGLATIDARSNDPGNEARVLLGQTTQRGRWAAWGRRQTIPVILRFGFPAIIDHVTLTAAPGAGQFECTPPVISASATAIDPGSFLPLEGTWSAEAPESRTLRFAPRRADGVLVLYAPTSCDFAQGMTRIRVGGAGMGVRVRYRAAASANLEAKAWQDVDDGATQLTLPGMRFVQLQYELWSTYADVGPILHHAHIGRLRFTPDAAPLATVSH